MYKHKIIFFLLIFFNYGLLNSQNVAKPKVLIITTGGTIASRTGAPLIEGSELVHAVPQLSQYGDIEVEETAFFLNLAHRRKTPIILVGSMRSSSKISTYGPANLLNAVRIGISKEAIGKGVLVVMNNRRVDAFPSTEFGFIGFADPDTVIFYRSFIKTHAIDSEFDIFELDSLPKVDIVKDFAGIDAEILTYFINRQNNGLVISSFAGGRLSSGMIEGLTNLPENHKKPIVILVNDYHEKEFSY